jgi:hypothetical protein
VEWKRIREMIYFAKAFSQFSNCLAKNTVVAERDGSNVFDRLWFLWFANNLQSPEYSQFDKYANGKYEASQQRKQNASRFIN